MFPSCQMFVIVLFIISIIVTKVTSIFQNHSIECINKIKLLNLKNPKKSPEKIPKLCYILLVILHVLW